MKVLKNNEKVNFENWPRPKSREKHWRDGRSAKELARFITKANGQLPKEIKEILSQHSLFAGDDFIVYPEFLSGFGKGFGRGGGRQHDLLMTSKKNSLVVGVEAKADEPFDDKIEKWLVKSKSGNGENRKKRADAFAKAIFGADKSSNDILPLSYQLLSATVGTLADAQRQSAKNAMLLVLVLKKDGDYSEKKIKENKDNFYKYVDLLGSCPPYRLPGFPEINFNIEYREVQI